MDYTAKNKDGQVIAYCINVMGRSWLCWPGKRALRAASWTGLKQLPGVAVIYRDLGVIQEVEWVSA